VSEQLPPTVTEIDRLNRTTFDALASEYNDSMRLTTANFHDLSRGFFERHVYDAADQDFALLDLGAGTGFVSSLLSHAKGLVLAIDISFQMLVHALVPDNIQRHKICGSAFALPLGNATVGRIVSSLASSFLRAEALKEVSRVLRPEGLFIFSMPSKAWTDTIRGLGDLEKTTFVSRAGFSSVAFSFTYTQNEMSQLLDKYEFDVLESTVSRGISLRNYDRSVSPTLVEAAKQNRLPLDEMPILELYACRKRVGGG